MLKKIENYIELMVVDEDREIYKRLQEDLQDHFRGKGITKFILTNTSRIGFEQSECNPEYIIINPLSMRNHGEYMQKVRQLTNTAIIVWGGSYDAEQRIALLEDGAHSILNESTAYIECFLSIRNLLSLKYGIIDTDKLVYKELILEPDSRNAYFQGDMVRLTDKEYGVLKYLFDNIGRYLSFSQIYRKAWGSEPLNAEKSIYNIVYQLKKKLGAGFDSSYVEIKRGYGYRLLP